MKLNNKFIDTITKKDPLLISFEEYVKEAILNESGTHQPSTYYSPSSMDCMRRMLFKRYNLPYTEEKDYKMLGMADTGTKRHLTIQTALFNYKNSQWEFIDPAVYVENLHKQNRLLDTEVESKAGLEYRMTNKKYNVRFSCDGILFCRYDLKYYLFEFKNQTSHQTKNKIGVDNKHKTQVTAYCTFLGLNKAIVLYENRDYCSLVAPEIFEVTSEMKKALLKKLLACNLFFERKLVPPVPKAKSQNFCKYCPYKNACTSYGDGTAEFKEIKE